MRKNAICIVVSTILLLIGGGMILACGAGLYLYSWLQIEPIAVEPDSTESERIAAVDAWLDEQFENDKFNGGVLVVRDGKVLLSKTCGFTDHHATQRLDDHSAFRLASVSKQFTAAGVLRLAEKGLITLDDPVAKHLEGFTMENVTVRHLLNQTSGIPDEYMAIAEQHRESIGDVLTISKAVELVNQHCEPTDAPNETMEYSNTNYILLAGIIESVSGSSYETFMAEELFKPLGMKDTRVWNLLSGERSPNQTFDFEQVDDQRTPIETTWIDGVAGDGGVFSSLHDFVIWDQFWSGNSVVSDALLKEAFVRPALSDGDRSSYGFGWVVERKRQWHNGAWLGANTHFVRYPETRCCVVVLDNSANLRLGKIAEEIEKTLQPILSGK